VSDREPDSRTLNFAGDVDEQCRPLPQLPECWVSSGLVTGVGGQAAREADDVAVLIAVGGHLLIQSKKGLNLGKTPSSRLAKALRQVVGQYLHGIPGTGGGLRPVDPARDRFLIVTDGPG
jgi:hypothetical protein